MPKIVQKNPKNWDLFCFQNKFSAVFSLFKLSRVFKFISIFFIKISSSTWSSFVWMLIFIHSANISNDMMKMHIICLTELEEKEQCRYMSVVIFNVKQLQIFCMLSKVSRPESTISFTRASLWRGGASFTIKVGVSKSKWFGPIFMRICQKFLIFY